MFALGTLCLSTHSLSALPLSALYHGDREGVYAFLQARLYPTPPTDTRRLTNEAPGGQRSQLQHFVVKGVFQVSGNEMCASVPEAEGSEVKAWSCLAK